MNGTSASAFGFIVFGCLMALFNFINQKIENKRQEEYRKTLPLKEGALELTEVQK